MAERRVTFRKPAPLSQQAAAAVERFTTGTEAINTFGGKQQAMTQRAIDRIRRTNGFPLEAAVRPAVPSKAYKLLERLLAKRRAPGEESEASITWGAQSDFTVAELKPPELPILRGVHIVDSDGTPPEEPAVTIVYTEVARRTHEFRVVNPVDSEDWVDIEVIDDITFQRESDGVFVQFILNNPQ